MFSAVCHSISSISLGQILRSDAEILPNHCPTDPCPGSGKLQRYLCLDCNFDSHFCKRKVPWIFWCGFDLDRPHDIGCPWNLKDVSSFLPSASLHKNLVDGLSSGTPWVSRSTQAAFKQESSYL